MSRVRGTNYQAILRSFDLVDGDASERIHELRDFLPDGSGRVTTGDVAALLLREALTTTHARTRLGVNGL